MADNNDEMEEDDDDGNSLYYHWEVDRSADKWQWGMGFLQSRNTYNPIIWEEPEEDIFIYQMYRLFGNSLKTRRFILCLSDSPSYMIYLYLHVQAFYVLNMKKRCDIFYAEDLLETFYNYDNVRKDTLYNTDLLIIPYFTLDHMGINKIRGNLSTLLSFRKAHNLSTITDLYLKGRIRSEESCTDQIKRVNDNLGELAYDVFSGNRAKYMFINVPDKTKNNLKSDFTTVDQNSISIKKGK